MLILGVSLHVLEGEANLEKDGVDDSSPVPMPGGSGETMSKGDFVRMQVLVRYFGNSRPSRENLAIIVSHPVPSHPLDSTRLCGRIGS